MPLSDHGQALSIASYIASLAIGLASTVYLVRWMTKMMDPSARSAADAEARVRPLLRKLGKEHVELTDHETRVACDLVNPDDINVRFKDIGGLDSVAEALREAIVWPMRHEHLFQSSRLLKPPKGILLSGPPGCGKTMLAKAVAAEAGCCFINMQTSTMLNMYYGETQKLVLGLFGLALKLQPSVIFIDEIDTFLRSRNAVDHESTTMLKAQFMSLWDGLLSAGNHQVIILAATNRPSDVDEAILRRLPLRFAVSRPNAVQRKSILRLVLAEENYDELDLDELARRSEGMSGSDLHELCRSAAMCRVREYVTQQEQSEIDDEEIDTEVGDDEFGLRSMQMKDFEALLANHHHDCFLPTDWTHSLIDIALHIQFPHKQALFETVFILQSNTRGWLSSVSCHVISSSTFHRFSKI